MTTALDVPETVFVDFVNDVRYLDAFSTAVSVALEKLSNEHDVGAAVVTSEYFKQSVRRWAPLLSEEHNKLWPTIAIMDTVDVLNEQASSGFDFKNNVMTVYLWDQFDTALWGYMAIWLAIEPRIISVYDPPKNKKSREIFEQMKGRLLGSPNPEYEDARRLVEFMDRSCSKNLMTQTRFEPFLSAIEVKPIMNETVKEAIIELRFVRNALVHRLGFADQRMVSCIRSFRAQKGELLHVPDEVFTDIYEFSAFLYFQSVRIAFHERWGNKLGA